MADPETTPDDTAIGAPCWIDLFTSDPDASRAFYGELFGWTSEESGPEYGGYINFLRDGAPAAGCMRNDGSAGTPDTWTVYLATADIKSLVDAVADHGGQVMVSAMDVGDLGAMAVVADPGGGVIGAWQPDTFAGFATRNETGTPGWFELHTREYAKAVDFYRDVFHWDAHVASDVPEFRYTTLLTGEDQKAGIMDASMFPPDAPLGWSIYFVVDDTDAAIARAVELGASVVIPAEDTPFGRLAQLADPTGALFKLVAG